MFAINRYKYIDTLTHAPFDIFARKLELAEEIVERINCMPQFKLRRKKIFFAKKVFTDIPPYELEQAQLECIEEWEEKLHVKN